MPTLKELNNRFTYHKPIPEMNQEARYGQIRETALRFARDITMVTPESREQSLAVVKLEEVVFWANAAIARHETE